jgi:hypothetical protein
MLFPAEVAFKLVDAPEQTVEGLADDAVIVGNAVTVRVRVLELAVVVLAQGLLDVRVHVMASLVAKLESE